MIGIYKLISPPGKCYIGQSMNIEKRLNQYKNRHTKEQPKIHGALQKYGWDNFEVEILFETKKRYKHIKILLDILEKKYIKHFNSIKNGYNITLGGDGTFGRITSEETKQKLSKAAKQQWLSMTDEELISIKNKRRIIKTGSKLSDKTKEKCRQAKLGNKNPNFGKTPSKETIEKMLKSSNTKKIYQYDLNGIFIKEWDSANQATKELNLYNGGISRNLNGKRKYCGGYIWKY